jgi:hypothetical protein
LPSLFAYDVEVSGMDFPTVGGRLAYRLRAALGGHWVWSGGHLVTDTLRDRVEIMKVVESLWTSQPDAFRGLRDVKAVTGWGPSSKACGDFVANGLLGGLEKEIRSLLSQNQVDLGSVKVSRVHEVRGWVVQNAAAISISVRSRMELTDDLRAFMARTKGSKDTVGLWVADKSSSMKGEVVAIAGALRSHRRRLLALNPRDEVRDVIESAPEDEDVVTVLSGRTEYDYPAGALRVIVRTHDLRRFGVDPKRALRILKIEPRVRFRLVEAIAKVAQNRGWIGDAYRTDSSPGAFLSAEDVGFDTHLRFGGGQVASPEERGFLGNLRRYGTYRQIPGLSASSPLRIGVINATGTSAHQYMTKLQNAGGSIGLALELTKETELSDLSRAGLEKGLESLSGKGVQLVLALFPDESETEDDEWGAYYDLKSLTVGRGIPSQVVYRTTMEKDYSVGNVLLGILGKTGNIPFVLGSPLSYADVVVGIDIAREKKKRLAGSLSATAIARIYFSDGQFVRYVIHDAPLEGETIPDNVLQALFPINEFAGKRVVVHRDGYFRGQEKSALHQWAKRASATFHLVEVIKSGTPRIYAHRNGEIAQPPKGTVFQLSDTEAFLVSSLPPFADATPQPLHLRTDGSLSIRRAVHSVLAMTLLHYGSLRAPRLPVTIHYSDRIAYLAIRGIKPKEMEGSIPYWL